MTRAQLLQMVRMLYRLSPEQILRVETFIEALDVVLTDGQLEAVWVYVAAVVQEPESKQETA